MNEDELKDLVTRLMRGLNHDLKNPLGAADGYVDLLLQGFRGDISDEQRQTLERVRTLIASGVAILEDVVAYARASVGELRVNATDADLKPIVRMTMERHAKRAADAGITLDFQAPSEAVRVKTDGDLVGQIVHRLLANALDHTPDGGRVDVSVARVDGRAVVRVRDTGEGIPEEDRERVFVAFERGTPAVRTRETPGIGFGLALADAFARLLGGSLEVGDGSELVLELGDYHGD